MDTYNAIKQIVDEYLSAYQPADLVYGTWGASDVKLNGKPLSVPLDMVDVPEGTTVTIGKRVTLMMKQGGQKYALIGVLG